MEGSKNYTLIIIEIEIFYLNFYFLLCLRMITANNQLILEENIDENFQPTEEEIIEYAEFIGIDPENVSYCLING